MRKAVIAAFAGVLLLLGAGLWWQRLQTVPAGALALTPANFGEVVAAFNAGAEGKRLLAMFSPT